MTINRQEQNMLTFDWLEIEPVRMLKFDVLVKKMKDCNWGVVGREGKGGAKRGRNIGGTVMIAPTLEHLKGSKNLNK